MASTPELNVFKPMRDALAPGERIEAYLMTAEAAVAVTARRLIVASDRRLTLAIEADRLRRVEFTLEKGRPAMLTLVPEWPSNLPQFLVIKPDQFEHLYELIDVLRARMGILD